MFNVNKIQLPDIVNYKKDLKKTDVFWTQIKEIMSDYDIVCDDIVISGHKYCKGDIVVQEVLCSGDKLVIGLLKLILLRGNEPHFIVSQCEANKAQLGGYYNSHVAESELKMWTVDSLADKKPLIKRGTAASFSFVLHHHISFNHC